MQGAIEEFPLSRIPKPDATDSGSESLDHGHKSAADVVRGWARAGIVIRRCALVGNRTPDWLRQVGGEMIQGEWRSSQTGPTSQERNTKNKYVAGARSRAKELCTRS